MKYYIAVEMNVLTLYMYQYAIYKKQWWAIKANCKRIYIMKLIMFSFKIHRIIWIVVKNIKSWRVRTGTNRIVVLCESKEMT